MVNLIFEKIEDYKKVFKLYKDYKSIQTQFKQ